jgi:ubiquinone/menaquinone biosynthesis C-methylase UbiE
VKIGASFADSRAAQLVFRLIGLVMESRFRYRFSNPVRILKAAGIRPGQEVLEVGCGTGFFTTPAANLVGDEGRIYALDPHPLAIEEVGAKVRDAGLNNVRLIRGDATEAGLASGSMDLILLFGVIPSPTLPLNHLLPEMYRLLRSEGALAVWTAFPWWSPASVTKSGLFVYAGRRSGIHNFRKATEL